MVALNLAQCLQDVVHPLLGLKVISELHGHTFDFDVLGHVFKPSFKTWLKGVAVRAAVPKKLNHFDFALGTFSGHALVQGQIINAFSDGGGALCENR